jgi:DNA gyrase subunit B/topoisomerase-4 subunit B
MRRGRSKLEDCERHGPGSGSELLVVEGDSAALAVCQARDPRVQAVLAMQGKPMKALRAPDGKVAPNPFLRALTEAVGAGRGAAFDPSALRYERVVLLMDPDADGIHCGALLLMFFHRWMQPLLDQGHVEIVRAPIGEITVLDGEAPHYAFSDAQFQAMSTALRNGGRPAFRALRYRGLGSLDRNVLGELCLDPQTRRSQVLGAADARTVMEVFASLGTVPAQQPLL